MNTSSCFLPITRKTLQENIKTFKRQRVGTIFYACSFDTYDCSFTQSTALSLTMKIQNFHCFSLLLFSSMSKDSGHGNKLFILGKLDKVHIAQRTIERQGLRESGTFLERHLPTISFQVQLSTSHILTQHTISKNRKVY